MPSRTPELTLPTAAERHVGGICLDLDRLAASLCLSEAQVKDLFGDGRVAAFFAEEWALTYYGLPRRTDRNLPGDHFVRVMNERVNFARSKNLGVGRRQAADSTLERFLRTRKTITVVDIKPFPDIDFYPVDKERLLEELSAGRLDGNGWTRDQFLATFYGKQLSLFTVSAR